MLEPLSPDVGVFRDGRGFLGPLHAWRKVSEDRLWEVIPADRATHAQKWTAETCEHEKLTLDPAKHELFWSTSVKAVGAINGPLHFIGDDQARTSVEQNADEGAPMAWYGEPGAGVMSNDPCKHRRPHGVVIEGTAPDAHSSGDCCFLSGRKHHAYRRCTPVSSHSSVFANVLRSTQRHICHSQGSCVVSRRHSPCHLPELSSVMVIEQDGCTKTVAETAAPMARRSVGKVSDKGPVRIMDGTTTEKIADGIGERWRRQLLEDMRRGAHEAELGDVISEVVARCGRVAHSLEFPSLTKRMTEDLDG